MKPEIYPAWPAGWFKNDVVAKPAAKQHHGFTAPRSVARMLAPADIVSSRSIWNNPAGCKVVKRTFDCGLGRYSSQPPHATGNTVIATAQLSTHCNYPAGWCGDMSSMPHACLSQQRPLNMSSGVQARLVTLACTCELSLKFPALIYFPNWKQNLCSMIASSVCQSGMECSIAPFSPCTALHSTT